MKNIRIWVAGVSMAVVFAFASCTKSSNLFDLDINVDPNNPTKGSVKLLLPEAQRGMANWLQGMVNTQMGAVGQISSSDSYGYGANGFYGTWTSFYTGWGKDIDEIIKTSTEVGNKPYLGVAQAMKAYGFVTMVNLFGTCPYTEAFGGNLAEQNINPKFDAGKDIYAACYKLLDDATTNLNAASSIAITPDIFYNGSKANWIRFVNTLRLKMKITDRRVNTNAKADIQAALAATGGLINGTANDFTWKYGSQISPELRHPWYTAGYLAQMDFTYIEVDMMWKMFLKKDPRFPFYYKRQTTYLLNPNNPTDKGATPVQGAYLVYENTAWESGIQAGLLTRGKADSGFLAGFFGRYRGDQSGVPQDQDFRTAPGVYPAAGLYDDRAVTPVLLRSGGGNKGRGDGISPMMTSWMVKFWQAEAELAHGFGDPRATAEAAVREHIKYVSDFGVSKDVNAKAAAAADVNAFVTSFLADYDAAPTAEAKINAVLYQAWIAGWGNGFEAYNAMRRTGYPTGLRPPITLSSQFALRWPIPATEGALNPNAPSPLPIFFTEPVFWDVVKFKF
ncbi:MAG: SusD/RagB family nutrient-binding outer membrane lipoprotein [Bacteroidota bacterium]